jgi:hypothetical protein
VIAERTAREILLQAIEGLQVGERTRLSSLRVELEGITREVQDKVLLQLQEEDVILLMRDDNTSALKDIDHEAALHIAGNPRHLVYRS